MALSRDAILKHTGMLEPQEVHIPAWADESGDDVVLVRGLTSKEWDVHAARLQRQNADDNEPSANLSAGLIARCIVDENGAKIFKDGDVSVLGELRAGDVSKLSEAILEASGLTDASKKAVEGNSAAAQSGDSSSS